MLKRVVNGMNRINTDYVGNAHISVELVAFVLFKLGISFSFAVDVVNDSDGNAEQLEQSSDWDDCPFPIAGNDGDIARSILIYTCEFSQFRLTSQDGDFRVALHQHCTPRKERFAYCWIEIENSS